MSMLSCSTPVFATHSCTIKRICALVGNSPRDTTLAHINHTGLDRFDVQQRLIADWFIFLGGPQRVS